MMIFSYSRQMWKGIVHRFFLFVFFEEMDEVLLNIKTEEQAWETMIDKKDGKVVCIQNFSGTFTM